MGGEGGDQMSDDSLEKFHSDFGIVDPYLL